MTKKYDISWEYFDKLLEIFLDGFRENDHSFDDQRSDTKLLNILLDRLVKLDRWDDADYIRGILDQDPCGAMCESGVPSIKITLADMYGTIPGQEIGRLDRSMFLGKKPYIKHIILNEDPPKLNIDLEPLNFTDDKQDKRRNITSPGVHGEDIRIRTPKRDPGLS